MARIARGEELIESALAVIASATTVEQLRQAQAVVMPLCGLSLDMTAKLTGLSAGWVSKSRNRFLRGKPVGDASEPARGGRRRQHFSVEQEAKLLEPLLSQAREGGILVMGQIKPYLEEALGHPMALSSAYALLHRHNWRKLVPDKYHPKSDPAAQEAWKKNSPKRSSKFSKSGKVTPSA